MRSLLLSLLHAIGRRLAMFQAMAHTHTAGHAERQGALYICGDRAQGLGRRMQVMRWCGEHSSV
jgi:hypothetical protein